MYQNKGIINFDTLIFTYRIPDNLEITIPSHIKHIGRSSFAKTDLKLITFPPDSQLQVIDDYAFAETKIETLTIPSQVQSIGQFSFCKCYFLQNVNFESNSNLQVIKSNAFCNCNNLETITLPSQLNIIEESVFDNCIHLKNLTIPPDSNLQKIGPKAFMCTLIKSFNIPPRVTEIGRYCFSYCSELKTVTFSENSQLQTINSEAFSDTIIESITIPSQVTKIGSNCFYMSELKTVTFAENSQCQLIEEHAFDTFSLETINIPSGAVLGECCLGCSSNLQNITISPDNVNYKYIDNKFIVTRSDPNSDEYDKLFFARFESPKLVIPSFIKSFSSTCLYCTDFKEIEFSPDTQITTIDFDIFLANGIECVKMPSSVQQIKRCSYDGDSQIKTITFKQDSKLQKIDKLLFSELNNLESITIPPEVTEIGFGAFIRCLSLRNVTFMPGSKLKTIHERAFYRAPIQRIDFPSQLEVIGREAFANSELVSVSIPSSVKEIGENCFYECQKLQRVSFSPYSKLETIGKGAFEMTSIITMSIPPSVKSIGRYAFGFCENLKILCVEKNSQLETIDDNAFKIQCKLEKIISPIAFLNPILEKNEFDKLYLEITDDEVDLDQISGNIDSVDEICLPNANHVNLNVDCKFTVLHVPRSAQLTGSKITDPNRKIIFCNQNEFDLMSSEEFSSLYQNRNYINEGGSANIFKVPNPNIPNMFYALKVYRCNMPNNDNNNDDWGNDVEEDEEGNANEIVDIDHIRYFYGEYQMLYLINHPNIIKAYSFFIGDPHNPPAILLEYCSHSLHNSIRLLRNTDLISIIYEIAGAMQTVHRYYIIHRDLKPENILLDSKKHVKVCDFGISTLMDVETQRRTRTRTHGIGTLDYSAPELYDNNRPYNEKVDVYAFGILMLFVLTKGHPPSINIADVLNAVPIPIPNTINVLSRDLISRCTAFDYHDRPSFDEIVQIIAENNYKLIDNLTDDQINNIINHLNYKE